MSRPMSDPFTAGPGSSIVSFSLLSPSKSSANISRRLTPMISTSPTPRASAVLEWLRRSARKPNRRRRFQALVERARDNGRAPRLRGTSERPPFSFSSLYSSSRWVYRARPRFPFGSLMAQWQPLQLALGLGLGLGLNRGGNISAASAAGDLFLASVRHSTLS